MSSGLLCYEPVENDARSNQRIWGLSDWLSLDTALISITATALNKTSPRQKELVWSVLRQMMVVLLLG